MSTVEDVSLTAQLDELLATGRQMLAGARDGDWDRATELQGDCHSLAEALFAKPVSAVDAAAIADGIRRLMELHDQVMDLCKSARDDSMSGIDNLKQGRQAVTEYTSNSS